MWPLPTLRGETFAPDSRDIWLKRVLIDRAIRNGCLGLSRRYCWVKIAPFLQLPTELRLHIFKHVVSSTESSLSLFSITLVCKLFRECLQSDPTLWTTILIALPVLEFHRRNKSLAKFTQMTTLALEYSHERPVSVTVNLLRSIGHDAKDILSDPAVDHRLRQEYLANLVESHVASGIPVRDGPLSDFIPHLFRVALPSCRKLALECSSWRDIVDLTRLVKLNIQRNSTLPKLESFSMTYNPANTIEGLTYSHATSPWGGGDCSPPIRSSESDDRTITPLPFLRHVKINNVAHTWRLFSLSASPHPLANTKTLNILELSHTSISNIKPDGGRLTVPNVRRMIIGFVRPMDLVLAAQTLDLPALEELEIEVRVGDLKFRPRVSGLPLETDEIKRQTMERYQAIMKYFSLAHVRRLVLRRVVFYESKGEEYQAETNEEVSFAIRFFSEFRELEDLEVWFDDNSIELSRVVESPSDTLFPNLRSCFVGRM
ncbi:hypothetical protein PM082_019726 [Marasmius tenuissimus]|nr:hypothetical protein PM082_019726 [Marasmius tenuissimus]